MEKRIKLITSIAILTIVAVAAWTTDTGTCTITTIRVSPNTAPETPGIFLTDNDPETAWTFIQGSTTGWAELELAEPSLIYGLNIAGNLSGDTYITLEYQQNNKWLIFHAPEGS